MNVLWIVADQFGCGAYRCLFPAKYLQDNGLTENYLLFHVQLGITKDGRPVSFPIEGLAKGEGSPSFTDLDDIDVVVFQRAFGPIFEGWMTECRRRGIAVVVELDDDLWHIPSWNPASTMYEQGWVRKSLKRVLDVADHIIVSTSPLWEVVREQSGRRAGDISVCHNHLHPSVWGDAALAHVVPAENGTQTIIGWQGSKTHVADFKVAIPALQRILDEHPEVKLRFLGEVPQCIKDTLPADRWEFMMGVTFDRYTPTLKFAHFDIGIAPLTSARFNRSKSNLKWLEYSALGVPCVASNVYPYAKAIRQGETGFVASTDSEWFIALKTLVTDASLRRRMGEAAKREIWAKWSAEHHAPAWRKVFETVLKQRAA